MRVGRGGEGSAPAHEPAQPGDDLLEAERLGDVVVATRGDAGDAVLDGVARGEEEDGDVGVAAAQAAQDLEAVDVGEHHVEETTSGPNSRAARMPAMPVPADRTSQPS